MSKFRIGDKVRVSNLRPGMNPGKMDTLGHEYIIKGHAGEFDGEDSWSVTDVNCYYRYKDSELELLEGPVRTRTVTEIVEGNYGKVEVGGVDARGGRRIFVSATFVKAELTDAISTLIAIRDALEGGAS